MAFTVGEFPKGCQAGGHRHGIRGQGAGLVYGSDRCHEFHEVPSTGIGADRKSATDDLAVGHQVRANAGDLGHAAECHAEAAEDFVEDQQHAVLTAEPGERCEELLPLGQQSEVRRQRLDDRGRQLPPPRREQGFQRGAVVEPGDQRICSNAGRNAAAVGRAVARLVAGQARPRADQHRVRVPVVATRELQQLLASRGCAREPERGHHRLGAGIDEADALDTGNPGNDQLGEFQGACFGRAVTPAPGHCSLHGVLHGRVRMAEYQGTKGHAEVRIPAAIRILDPAARGRADEQWSAADAAERPHRRVHAARGNPQCPPEQFVGCTHRCSFNRRDTGVRDVPRS